MDDFLNMLGINSETYINAIRTTIKRPTIFLKRAPKEAFINAYNRDLMVAWKANMDIQFVLDGYACAKYVATYISKSGGGVSKLLRAAAADVADGNSRISNKLERFGSVLINASEISAQEAAAFCLGMAMTNSSRSDVFANTGQASDSEKLTDDSKDIYIKGATEKYTKRPTSMENVCFAEFLSWWQSGSLRKKGNKPSESSSNLFDLPSDEERDDEEDILNGTCNPPTQDTQYQRRDKAKILRFCNFPRATSSDDYWREQIMLFVPWRNEESDIIQKGDYENIAKTHEPTILENSKDYYFTRRYAESLSDEVVHINIEEVFEEIINDEETPDATTGTENFNLEEDMQYTSETITRKKGKVAEVFLPPKLIDAAQYFTVMRSLNTLQRRVVLEILHRLKNGGEPFYVFLSGGAGVGKSHVITAIVQSYLRHTTALAHITPEALPVIVCAPTGKAAFNVFGMTLHNVFRLPPMQYSGPLASLEEGLANTLRVRYRETNLFIIDEISMCGSTMFQRIDARQLFDRTKPFGGKSILAVGHLRQLPPVGEKIIFKCPDLGRSESVRSQLVGRNPLWQNFQYFELTEIMRQKNAHAFCKALNNMSEGVMDSQDIQLIKSREVPRLDAPTDAVWLFVTNKECEDFNKSLHRSLGTESIISTAIDIVTGTASEAEKQDFANEAKNFNRQENMGLLPTVNLQVGAIYFVTSNIDVADGLFNGATGVLKGIEYTTANSSNGTVPLSAWIEFCHPSIGQKVRNLASVTARMQKLKFDRNWTPVDPISRVLTKKKNGMQVTRNQVPVQPANGMTIAKAQGSSLPRVVISIKPGIRRENLYVACSRATNLEELYIVGTFVPPSRADMSDAVSIEMQILKQNLLTFSLKFPADFHGQRQLYYHNVEGYLTHRLDILNDPNIMEHEYLVFVEPKLKPADRVSLEGFTLCHRTNSSITSGFCNSEGILVFRKDSAPNFQLQTKFSSRNKTHCLLLSCSIENVRFIAVYRHPNFSQTEFFQLLSEELESHDPGTPLVLFGDANCDLKDSRSNNQILEYFRRFGLQSKLAASTSTTNYNTQLDVCFSNFQNLDVNVYETYYSYHKGLSMHWVAL